MTSGAPMGELDRQRMLQALALAEQAIGLSEPNPRVGCVLGFADGRVIGQGHTQRIGGPHAEVMALRDAAAQGLSTAGATAWVTLEPCAHHGRTPPCCDALVAAGVARAVVAMVDPFPQVAGEGLARLRAAGISVVLADADLTAAARDLNLGFLSRIERGRPWVRLKAALTIDGISALHNGVSQWITGDEARRDGHQWRKRAGAVLTGSGTVQADNPRLDVRLVDTQVQPMRILLDSSLRCAPDVRMLQAPGPTLVVHSQASAERTQAFEAAQVPLLSLPGHDGRVDLPALLHHLAERHVNELHVEAGARLNAAWLQAGLVDELLVYQAPRLAGPGQGLAAWPALSTLSAALDFHRIDCTAVGRDLRLRFLAHEPAI